MNLLVFTDDPDPLLVLPSVVLLPHTLRAAPAETSSARDAERADLAIVDARRDLSAARDLSRVLRSAATIPVIAVVREGDLVAVDGRWDLDDFLLPGAGPAEIEARLRLLAGRRRANSDQVVGDTVSLGELLINEPSYSVLLRGRPLHLTFREFALLKHLIEHPGRVFTRPQLLHSVWGYDFFGGTRTVDVHIRRLRAKLGSDHESLICTVRNVGYTARPLGSRGNDRRRVDHQPYDLQVERGPEG